MNKFHLLSFNELQQKMIKCKKVLWPNRMNLQLTKTSVMSIRKGAKYIVKTYIKSEKYSPPF